MQQKKKKTKKVLGIVSSTPSRKKEKYKHLFLLLHHIFLYRSQPLWVCTCARDWVELTKAFPPGRVRLIIILMASQSDANGSNGKARDGGKNGGEEAKPEMEVLKIRFAFWDKNMQGLKRKLYTLLWRVRACACMRVPQCAVMPMHDVSASSSSLSLQATACLLLKYHHANKCSEWTVLFWHKWWGERIFKRKRI